MVNGLPLDEGQNIITAVATGTAGNVASHSILIDAVTATPHVTLKANIESGIAPLTTYFSVTTSIPDSVVSYSVDFEGDSVVDYMGPTFEDINFTYATEGVYFPTVNVLDDQSNVYSDTVVIIVLNQTELDALLRAKWEAMKAALIAGDNVTALNYFTENSKVKYADMFTGLGSTELNLILSSFSDFELYTSSEHVAEGGLIRTESTGTFSYPIVFVQDEYGIWLIYGF